MDLILFQHHLHLMGDRKLSGLCCPRPLPVPPAFHALPSFLARLPGAPHRGSHGLRDLRPAQGPPPFHCPGSQAPHPAAQIWQRELSAQPGHCRSHGHYLGSQKRLLSWKLGIHGSVKGDFGHAHDQHLLLRRLRKRRGGAESRERGWRGRGVRGKPGWRGPRHHLGPP